MNLFSALTDYFIRFVYQLSNRRKRPCKLPTFRYEGFFVCQKTYVERRRRLRNGDGVHTTKLRNIRFSKGLTSGVGRKSKEHSMANQDQQNQGGQDQKGGQGGQQQGGQNQQPGQQTQKPGQGGQQGGQGGQQGGQGGQNR